MKVGDESEGVAKVGDDLKIRRVRGMGEDWSLKPSKLYVGVVTDILPSAIFRPYESLVDEYESYEIFLDPSHFRIPLIWCNICIPVQSSSKQDPKSFKFLVCFIQIRRVSQNNRGRYRVMRSGKRSYDGLSGEVREEELLPLWDTNCTGKIKRSFFFKTFAIHPFGTLKRRSQKGWWVETFFFFEFRYWC